MLSPVAYFAILVAAFATAFAGAASFGAGARLEPEPWRYYANERSGVQAQLPGDLLPAAPARFGQGREFLSRQGDAVVTVAGEAWAETLRERREREIGSLARRGARIVSIDLGENWFAITGELLGEEFYARVQETKSCSGLPIYARLDIRFDSDASHRFQPMVETMAQSLSGCAPATA